MEFDWNNPPFNLNSSLSLKGIEESFEDPFAVRLLPDSRRFAVQARFFNLGMSASGVRSRLDRLLDRLRAMLVQGLVSGKRVEAELADVVLEGQKATSLALVFSELLGNALEHGGDQITVTLAEHDNDVTMTVADNGPGLGEASDGTGMSIVKALVRDELKVFAGEGIPMVPKTGG